MPDSVPTLATNEYSRELRFSIGSCLLLSVKCELQATGRLLYGVNGNAVHEF